MNTKMLPLLVVVLSACSGPGENEVSTIGGVWTGTIDTLQSGQIVVRNPAQGLWEHPHRFIERRRVGVDEVRGVGPAVFGKVVAVEIDALGRVYVLDSHGPSVRLFDSSGGYVRSMGRKGRGPGELIAPEGMTWQNDSTLWIVDNTQWRYSVYDTSGVHRGDFPRAALGFLWPWPGRFVGDRLIEVRVMGSERRLVAVDPRASDAPRDSFPYSDVPPEHWSPGYVLRQGETLRWVSIPFLAGYVWALDSAGNVWGGDTREPYLIKRSLEGDTSLVITIERPPVRVSPREREEAITSLGRIDDSVDPGRIPNQKAVFRAVVPSTDGGVWLIREGAGDEWTADVLDAAGRYMGTATLPVKPDLSVRPISRGSTLWLVAKNALDVQQVVQLELQTVSRSQGATSDNKRLAPPRPAAAPEKPGAGILSSSKVV